MLARKVIVGKIGFLRLVVLVSVTILFSCSQVKFVPEEKYLINKVEVDINTPELDKAEAKTFVRQKENYKILGFLKFHIGRAHV